MSEPSSAPIPDITIDHAALERQLDTLATFSASPAPGVTRVLWSEEDMQARAYLKKLCAAADLDLREDAVGNLFARWEGSDPTLPPVASGSHIDAIPNSGRYDGTVGVLGALEALRALRRAGFVPRRSLELLLFTAEEPTRFGLGCLGSRLLAGMLSPAEAVQLTDAQGQPFEALRQHAGYGAYDLADVQLESGAYAAFVELHIEQGPLLEAAGLPLGLVEHIAAPGALRVHLTGEGGHAGAVLMGNRRDAGLAAAELALAVEQAALASNSPNTVATTGVLELAPGAVNSIPAQARLEIDVRDVALAPRDQTLAAIEQAAHAIGTRRGVQVAIERLNADPPAACDTQLVEAAAQMCAAQGIGYQRMISRAYHDALFMARVCPSMMLFLPCRAGVSHRPDEYADPQDIATGVHALAHLLARLAA